MSNERAARQEVIDAAIALRKHLSPGRSGNVSRRWEGFEGGFHVTPSGMRAEDLRLDDVVLVGADGQVKRGRRVSSSEWRFHLAAYQARADRRAVVHCHSFAATVLACAHKPIPAFHYMVAVGGGPDIPLVPYETFGTEALSDGVRAVVTSRDACLLANHGQLVLGKSLAGALELAHEVENLAAQYLELLKLGEVHLLDAAEMQRVLERFRTYGQNAQASARASEADPRRHT